jgi:type IV secretory pathway VirB2 component (pilin)
MNNKIKAMLATLAVIFSGTVVVYLFLMHTRAFLGFLIGVVGLFGARELYHSLVSYYNEQDRLKSKHK